MAQTGIDVASTGFPAGTRVYGSQGLMSIEDIRVGDTVLSQSEQGKREYKRVLNAFVYDDKTLRSITFRVIDGDRSMSICTSSDQAFLTVEQQGYVGDDGEWEDSRYPTGWIAAQRLLPDGTRLDRFADGRLAEPYQDARHHHLLQLIDGSLAEVAANAPVYRTNKRGCGWVRHRGQAPFEPDDSVDGYVVDFIDGGLVEQRVSLDKSIYYSGNPHFKTRVYSIEVEDFGTYFVANGILVHGTNGRDFG